MNKKQRKEIREIILKHRRPVIVTFYGVAIEDLERDELEAVIHLLMEEKEAAHGYRFHPSSLW